MDIPSEEKKASPVEIVQHLVTPLALAIPLQKAKTHGSVKPLKKENL